MILKGDGITIYNPHTQARAEIKKLVEQNRELDQGLDFDEKGLSRREKEQFTTIAWGYIAS